MLHFSKGMHYAFCETSDDDSGTLVGANAPTYQGSDYAPQSQQGSSPTSSASQASTAPSPVQPMRMEAYIPDSITQCTSTSTAIAVDKFAEFAEFLAYIDQELHLKRASFYLYKAYYEFVNYFQRFKVAPVAFTALCRKLKKIQAWFTSSECKSLERQNCLSAEYWKSLPEAPSMQNRDSTFAVGFDDDDLLADFDLVEFEDD
ncbi:hypothetical protein HK100_000594 [Physocladia obscura]|uniref:Uncharacterized protein n=1 Tax=Physocladia obscura TaxID=109957 RepID=A0AAD5T836_9FUNG|nr:hypothetical protein HK100_000594 [Physocladia obscura]